MTSIEEQSSGSSSPSTSSVTEYIEAHEKKTRKRKRKLCEACQQAEAVEKKKQRKFTWTEKNRPAFEKCQKTRKLKQAVEQAKKEFGLLLVEELNQMSTNGMISDELRDKKTEAQNKLNSAQAEYSSFIEKSTVSPTPLTPVTSN